MRTFHIHPAALTTVLLTALLLTGCGKPATGNASIETAPAKTPVEAQSPQRTSSATAPAATPNQYLQQSQGALRSRDYEQAATALFSAPQQANLSAQQAEAIAAQMRQLQSSRASAVASGDPRAKAAADRLRRSATVR